MDPNGNPLTDEGSSPNLSPANCTGGNHSNTLRLSDSPDNASHDSTDCPSHNSRQTSTDSDPNTADQLNDDLSLADDSEDADTDADSAVSDTSQLSDEEANLNAPQPTNSPAQPPRLLKDPGPSPLHASRHLGHFMAKHASEMSFALSGIAYIATNLDATLATNPTLTAVGSGIMYFDSAIAFAEAARLLSIDDHHVFENRIKAAANFINGCQLAICSPPTLAATAICPPATALALASFTIGVLCETILTGFERHRAYVECDAAHWLLDTMKAIEYFDAQIAELKPFANGAQEKTNLFFQVCPLEDVNEIYAALLAKRNALLAELSSRAKVFQQSPVDADNPQDTMARDKLSKCTKSLNTDRFADWLSLQIAALEAADHFICNHPDSVDETQIANRNLLLLDIEQRCQWALAQDPSLETEILRQTDLITNPFVIEKPALAWQEKCAVSVNFLKKDLAYSLNKPASDFDRQRNHARQTQLESYHHLQQEMFYIKLMTCTAMSIITIGAVAASAACPPAAIPIVLLALVASYYITRHANKLRQVAQESYQAVPTALRVNASAPLLPPVSTMMTGKSSIGWPKTLRSSFNNLFSTTKTPVHCAALSAA